MLKKIIIFIVLSIITGLVWLLNLKYKNSDISRVFYSFISISASYFFLKLSLEELVSRKIKDTKTRYTFRKTTQYLFVIVSFLTVLRIWIPNPQALLVAYGLIAAGVAIALQDVFKNFAGALAIFLSGVYQIGDRVQVNSYYGDVIDIGIFYTTLIELREWVDGDQTTGRITLMPNGQVISFPVQNYTKDHNFIWDEISLPITYTSNWKKAVDIIHSLVINKTAEITKRAEREISQLEEKYYLSKRNIEPTVFVIPTDNWIMLRIRYVTDVRERRLFQNEIAKLILDEIKKASDITISSQTLTISAAQYPKSND